MSKPFYINIELLNKDEVVASGVKEKVGTGGRARTFLAKAATAAATRLVSDEKVVTGMTEQLITKIQTAITEMGITASIQKKFQKGPFVVVRVEVTDIDKMAVVNAAKGAEFAAHFSSLLSAVTDLGLAESVIPSIDDKVSQQAHTAMMEKFAETIPIKMAEAGVNVDITVLSAEEEAEYFFSVVDAFH